jgi:hypothetical protein
LERVVVGAGQYYVTVALVTNQCVRSLTSFRRFLRHGLHHDESGRYPVGLTDRGGKKGLTTRPFLLAFVA